MMRVGWIVAFMFVVACGQKDDLEQSKIDIAEITVQKIASEAYPQWAMSNPSQECPRTISELAKFVNSEQMLIDPWKQPIKFVCGPGAPPEVKGLGAYSLGPDQKEGTKDDIKSWAPRK